jgi:hypothetical protein
MRHIGADLAPARPPPSAGVFFVRGAAETPRSCAPVPRCLLPTANATVVATKALLCKSMRSGADMSKLIASSIAAHVVNRGT